MFKLGTIVKDKASGVSGCLMNLEVRGTPTEYILHYYFQPKSLNGEDGLPSSRTWITTDRIIGGEVVDGSGLPYAVLGTEVEDTVTGFKGMATALIYYINGCTHVAVQPKGTNAKTGKMNESYDFDIRLLKGKAVPAYNEQQLKESRASAPSPEPCERFSPRAIEGARR